MPETVWPKPVRRKDMSVSTDPWPEELRLTEQGRVLRIRFDNGQAYDLTAEYLRVMSPSAEVQGHSPSERKVQHGKSKVAIMQVEPVGSYAVRLVFDDMHSTGLYTWAYLNELGATFDDKWAAYLAELAEKGLGR